MKGSIIDYRVSNQLTEETMNKMSLKSYKMSELSYKADYKSTDVRHLAYNATNLNN